MVTFSVPVIPTYALVPLMAVAGSVTTNVAEHVVLFSVVGGVLLLASAASIFCVLKKIVPFFNGRRGQPPDGQRGTRLRHSRYLQPIIEQEKERRKMLADMATAAARPSFAMRPLPAAVTSVTSQPPVINRQQKMLEAMTEQSTHMIQLVTAVQDMKTQQVQAATDAKKQNRWKLGVMFATLAVTVTLVLIAVL
jgi:hypothetical protein